MSQWHEVHRLGRENPILPGVFIGWVGLVLDLLEAAFEVFWPMAERQNGGTSLGQ
jgi:hypothetical protein